VQAVQEHQQRAGVGLHRARDIAQHDQAAGPDPGRLAGDPDRLAAATPGLAQGPAQVSVAENQLSGALGRLIALSEAYPDLKANANFQQLQAELSDLENKIAASRRFFNSAVQEYNTGIQRFPAALFATSFGFASKDYFDLGEDRKAVTDAPQVKF